MLFDGSQMPSAPFPTLFSDVMHRRRANRTAALLFAVSISFWSLSAQVIEQDRSTRTLDAASVDKAWQKASEKYNKRRDEILATVEKEATAGPFQPDWQSLANYEVPDWGWGTDEITSELATKFRSYPEGHLIFPNADPSSIRLMIV